MTDTETFIASLEETIPSLMREAKIPGLSIAVIRNGSILWSRGFGVKKAEACEPVTTETVFEGASFSKPLFAYGVLQLASEGLLDLDVPLITYLPDRSFCDDPRLDRITAWMVLSHTTGFPNWRRRGKPLTLDWAPGERFGYSGEGYVYLQGAVERLTGLRLQRYMHETVLSPLEMTQSSYVWRRAYLSQAATGHRSDGTPYRKGHLSRANAAASLHTTPKDFGRFLGHVLNANDMTAPQVHITGNLWWGLGWGLQREEGNEILWHWGDNPGFKNFVAGRRRERSGVVVMTNGDNGLRVWEEIARRVLGLDGEIFDWLSEEFYGRELKR